MPITRSAKKALRQSERRKVRNLKVKRGLKASLKKAESLIASKDTAGALQLLPQLQKQLDKAAKKGVIKKNAASRKKARLQKSLKRASS